MADLRAQHRRQVLHDEPHQSLRVERPLRPEREAPDVRHKPAATPSRAATTNGIASFPTTFVVTRSTPAAAVAVLVATVVAGGFLTATHGGSGCLFVV